MLPFANIRVIDFTHVIAGPFCAYQLAVLGADVIKIESPDSPDMVRGDGAKDGRDDNAVRSMFASQNANKRSVAIDLKTREGRDLALDLVRGADVVIENYRSGALSALGLGYEDVRSLNPAIVYCSLTGFGQTGPKAEHTAYDNVIQAFSGLMAATGSEQTGPVKVGPPVLDYGTGAQAAFAIAAALYKRAQTGEGDYIDVAMSDAALMLMGANITHYNMAGECAPLSGNDSISKPGYCCYQTADGLLMIGAYTVQQHQSLWRALGETKHAESLEGTSLDEMADRYLDDKATLAGIFINKTADEWEKLLNDAKVPAARVRTVDEAISHQQTASRSVLQSLDGESGAQHLPIAAFGFASGNPALTRAPASHGQHTIEVLREAGYDDAAIEELVKKNVIRTA